MIDYEKLKIAHEIAQNIGIDTGESTKISCNFYDWGYDYDVTQKGVSMGFSDIDIMLIFLLELTQPKPKYAVGQEVWYLNNNEIKSLKIAYIVLPHYRSAGLEGCWVNELHLFPTKQALIQSQIDYWTKLMQNEPWQRIRRRLLYLKSNEISTHDEDTSPE